MQRFDFKYPVFHQSRINGQCKYLKLSICLYPAIQRGTTRVLQESGYYPFLETFVKTDVYLKAHDKQTLKWTQLKSFAK